MAPTPAPAYTFTYTGPGYTYRYTYPDYTYSNYNPYDDPSNVFNDVARTATSIWLITVAVIIGINALGLIIVGIVYFQRQKNRKRWYGPMAAHYRNGGLPPWAAGGGGSVKAPLLSNDYNAGSGVTYPPTNSDPKAQYEPPTQFGVYGNVPPSNTHTTGPYSNATGVTGYTGASYHTATSSTPPPQTHSPQPEPFGRHSQYTSTTSAYEPYAAPNAYNAPTGVYSAVPNAYSVVPQSVYNETRNSYAPPAALPPHYKAPGSPGPPDVQSPHSAVPAYESPTKGPEYTHAQASGSHPPAYAGGGGGGGGAFGGGDYPREKGWEYTSPPIGSPPKQ